MRFLWLTTIFASMLALSVSAHAGVIKTLTFDTSPSDYPLQNNVWYTLIRSGSDMSSFYQGVTFKAPLTGTGPVRALDPVLISPDSRSSCIREYYAGSLTASFGCNVLGLSIGDRDVVAWDQTEGAIDVIFDVPVNYVSIRAGYANEDRNTNGPDNTPFMSVYNSDSITTQNRIGLVTYDFTDIDCIGLCIGSYQTLEFTSTAENIRAIRLSAFAPDSGHYNRGFFDTLSYGTTDTTGTVPEPTSLALLSLGLAGLGFTRRRKRA